MYAKKYGAEFFMRTIITYGTFDILHVGHINLLKRAKAMGDYLIVGLSTDKFNNIKHKESFFSYEERKKILEAIKYVDLVIPENEWNQKIIDIKKYDAEVFVMGDDWKGQFNELSRYCHVFYIPRTKGISSSKIKRGLK